MHCKSLKNHFVNKSLEHLVLIISLQKSDKSSMVVRKVWYSDTNNVDLEIVLRGAVLFSLSRK